MVTVTVILYIYINGEFCMTMYRPCDQDTLLIGLYCHPAVIAPARRPAELAYFRFKPLPAQGAKGHGLPCKGP